MHIRNSQLLRRLTALFTICILAVAPAFAQGGTAETETHSHDHDHAHESEGLAGVRLLVADANADRLVVLGADDGAVLGSFTVPGPASVQQFVDTRYAAAIHGTANRVTFVHSGLSAVDHGDHADLVQGSPYVLFTVNTGQRPAHLASYGDDIAIFNDGSGTAAWFDARLLGLSLDYTQVNAKEADHGALAPFAGGKYLAIGLITSGTVEVFDRSGKSLASMGGCEGLHGQGVLAGRVVFGCTTGVMVVREGASGAFAAELIPNPSGSAEGARVSTIVSAGASRYLVGNFGEGFAVIDPQALTLRAYPASGTQLGGAIFEGGTRFARLGSDGVLRTFDLASGEELGSVAVTSPLVAGATRPSITVLGDLAIVTTPAENGVAVVDLGEVSVEARYHLDFTPSGVALMTIPGTTVH